jgi:hypothetical protein
VEFPVPKPTGRARPKSQGANQGMTSKKPTQRQDFKTGEFIVYAKRSIPRLCGNRWIVRPLCFQVTC